MKVYTASEALKSNKRLFVAKYDSSGGEMENVPHTHEFIEIVYILSGKMTHTIDGVEYNLKHGDVIFMNYGCVHGFRAETDYAYVNLLFSPELVSSDIVTPSNAFSVLCLTAFNEMRNESSFGRISFFGSERQDIENIIFAMLDEFSKKQTSWESAVYNYFNIFMIKMLRKTEMGIDAPELEDIWQKLSEYIDTNLASRLTLSELANKCFYNPSYFSRLFKERFKMTLVEYIARKRLERAVTLLESTNRSVEEIGREVGFSDAKSLYQAFSKYLNVSPSKCRKSKKTQEN